MSIAAYIKEDLEARLRSGEPLAGQLTLESLSAHYKVSFSPVRAAIAELIDEGLVRKGTNRRLLPNEEALGKSTNRNKSAPRPPRDMFQIVANDIVRLSLISEETELREEATARKYGISRSSLRIIFNRLAGIGILNHIPRRGWHIRPFRQEELQDFLEMRELLELKALELARPHLDTSDLQTMLDGNVVPVSEDEEVQVNNAIHAYLIEKANNRYIKDFFKSQGQYYDILFDWEEQDREIAIETVIQHRAILNALIARDWRTARKTLSYHIFNNHPILSKIQPSKMK